jgi:hypothetical protein
MKRNRASAFSVGVFLDLFFEIQKVGGPQDQRWEVNRHLLGLFEFLYSVAYALHVYVEYDRSEDQAKIGEGS